MLLLVDAATASRCASPREVATLDELAVIVLPPAPVPVIDPAPEPLIENVDVELPVITLEPVAVIVFELVRLALNDEDEVCVPACAIALTRVSLCRAVDSLSPVRVVIDRL